MNCWAHTVTPNTAVRKWSQLMPASWATKLPVTELLMLQRSHTNLQLQWHKRSSIQKRPKFKMGDRVHISKHKKLFEKVYISNWILEVFTMCKVYNTRLVTYRMMLAKSSNVDSMSKSCRRLSWWWWWYRYHVRLCCQIMYWFAPNYFKSVTVNFFLRNFELFKLVISVNILNEFEQLPWREFSVQPAKPSIPSAGQSVSDAGQSTDREQDCSAGLQSQQRRAHLDLPTGIPNHNFDVTSTDHLE